MFNISSRRLLELDNNVPDACEHSKLFFLFILRATERAENLNVLDNETSSSNNQELKNISV